MSLTQGKEGDKRFPFLLLILLASFSLLVSCHPHKPNRAAATTASDNGNDDFATQLQEILKPIDTTHKVAIKDVSANVRYVYELNEYQPIWVSGNKEGKDAKTFLSELEELQWDGLDPERYNLSGLKKLENELNRKTDASGVIAFDTAFTHSYLAAASDLLMGAVLPKDADSLWYHKNDTMWSAPQLLVNSDKYPSLNDYRSVVPTYTLLRDEYKRYNDLMGNQQLKSSIDQLQDSPGVSAHDSTTMDAVNTIIKAEVPWAQTGDNDSIGEEKQLLLWYQNYAGIVPTGKLDSNTLKHLSLQPQQIMQELKANMERVRWMQKSIGDFYIVVDVPAMELFFRKDGENVMHMRTVVGKAERQTPSLDASMANVVINPPWGVPPTILKKDVLPGITKSGQKYLTKKGLSAYDHKGKKINASGINAGNYKRYTYKQNPGDDNALGYVKFNLPNPWDIYLHDTPHRGDFVKRYRALSSGCIRLQEPQEMALYILAQIEGLRYTQDRLDSVIQTHKTRWEVLKTKIPVHIVYLTTFDDTTGKHIRFVNDVYKRDDRLLSLMK